jgi:hypothetical protein
MPPRKSPITPSPVTLPREEREVEKGKGKTQTRAKAESGALQGENLGVVADWGAKEKAAWENAVAGRKHWSKPLFDPTVHFKLQMRERG